MPTPMTVLPNSFSFVTNGEKSESPDRMANVSMWSFVRHISIASTESLMSAEFLPVYARSGISISSMPSSCRGVMASSKRCQSQYARFAVMRPLSTRRSRMRLTSGLGPGSWCPFFLRLPVPSARFS